MKKEMLINVAQSEECRIAIVEDGVLEELYVERASQESYVGNIYKGKIVNIEPSIQACFVDFGIGRNGFLHVSDVDPVYYKHLLPRHVLEEIEAEQEAEYGFNGGKRRPPRSDRPDSGPRGDRDRTRSRERDLPRRDDATLTPMTSWLPPEVSAAPAEDVGDFGSGLDEFGNSLTPPPLPKHVTARRPEPELLDDDGFGAGLDEFGNSLAPPPLPKAVTAPPRREAPPKRPAAEPELLEDDGFGSGLEFDDTTATFEEVIEITPADGEASDDKPKRKPRAVKGDKEKKPARRKKRGDDDAGEEPPTPTQTSAEHRTSPDDDGEVKPFFDDGFGFDIDAPNDRFNDTKPTVDDDAFGGFEEGSADGDESVENETLIVEPVDPEETEDFSPPERHMSDDGPRRSGGGRGRSDSRGDRGGDRGPPRRSSGGDRGGDRSDRGPRTGGGPRFQGRPSGPPPRDKGIPRLPIEQIFKRGQEVIVQVIKEGIGTKGPTLSTYVSIAGRYLVLMPSLGRVGVSRKIEEIESRRRLRDIMNDLNPPKGVGFIVRTAAIDREPAELQSDLAYLLRLWQVIVRRIRKVSAPVEIYRESDMITRTIRDNFKADITSITVDDPTAFQHASEFMQVVMPRYADRIKQHDNAEPLFQRYRIEEEIAKLNHKRLDLPRGGSIIIEQTEALVAIDVNSGTFRGDNDAEQNAFQMNVMAAKEIARQLRLRDLGGVIVNDFIDMRDERHRRIVEKTLHDALERDKARTKILRISQFGIIEMTRQRMQQSLKKRIYDDCPHCKGSGHVKTNETLGIDAMRMLHLASHKAIAGNPPLATVTVSVCTDAANYLLNKKRKDIAALEEKAKMEVTIVGVANASPDHLDVKCMDANGNEVRLLNPGPPPRMYSGKGPREKRFPQAQE